MLEDILNDPGEMHSAKSKKKPKRKRIDAEAPSTTTTAVTAPTMKPSKPAQPYSAPPPQAVSFDFMLDDMPTLPGNCPP